MSGIFGFKNLNFNIDDVKQELLDDKNNDFNFIEQDNLTFCQSRIRINDKNFHISEMEFNGNLIAFNGEIYNYKELQSEFLEDSEIVTNSDAEVLLKLLEKYGLKILNKLNGMFAFAYYEEKSGSTFLVNDRYGIKQLFYYMNKDSYVFSSKDAIITRMLDISFSFSEDYINSLFIKNIIDFENKLVNPNVHSVYGGEYIEITKDNKINKHRYYNFNDFDVKQLNLNYKNKKQIIDYFEELLIDAIKIRTPQNTPIAMTLSGGVDSSLIYTLLKEKLNQEVTVISYSNEDSKKDEYKIARKLTEKYNDKIIQVKYSKNDFEENYEKALITLNAPCCLSDAEYYRVYKKINEMNFKIVLEGHGADEILGGYANLYPSAFQQAIMEGKYLLAFHIWNLYKINIQTKNQIEHLKTLFADLKNKKKNIFLLNSVYLIAQKNLPKNLRYWDRMLIDNSVELRTPFLDYRVVEFLLKLPLEYKINKIGNKAILREILKKYNVDFVYKNKIKKGFTTSEEAIIRDQKDFLLKYYDKNRFNLDTTSFDNSVYKACCVGFLENYYNAN